MAEMLLEHGVDPNSLFTRMKRQCLLHKAVEKNFEDLVQLLMDYGANPDETDDIFKTPLHNACRSGFLELVKKLAGTDPNIRGGRNFSAALHVAYHSQHIELIKWLTDNSRASPRIPGGDGDIILHSLACKNREDNLVWWILQKSGVRPRKYFEAVSRQEIGFLKVLMKTRFFHPTKTDQDGYSLLHHAVWHSTSGCLEFLVQEAQENGIDLSSVPDCNGWTLLDWAVFLSHTSSVQLMLAHGASLNCTNKRGRTALHLLGLQPEWDKDTKVKFGFDDRDIDRVLKFPRGKKK